MPIFSLTLTTERAYSIGARLPLNVRVSGSDGDGKIKYIIKRAVSPFSLELERLHALRRLLAEGPEVQLVIGCGSDERAFIDEELSVQDRLARVVPHVRVHAWPA